MSDLWLKQFVHHGGGGPHSIMLRHERDHGACVRECSADNQTYDIRKDISHAGQNLHQINHHQPNAKNEL